MDRDEAQKLLGDDSGQSIQFSPDAADVQAQITGPPQPPAPFQRPSVAKSEREFREKYTQPGVPLDVDTGASTWERLMLEGRRSKDAQITYLENKYGKDKVRMTDNGELIFRVPDLENKGKEKDVLAIPHGKMTLSDLVNLSAAVPEVAGWIAGERGLTKLLPQLSGRGVLPAAARLGAGAVGAETAGALTKDIPANIYDRGQLNLGEIAKSRGESALADVAVGGALGAGGAFLRFFKAPLAGQRGQMQFDALEAAKALKAKYGETVPMTIGESTGVPLFSRAEAMVEKEPGGSGPIKKVKAEQESALRRLQSLMMGTSQPLDEEVGQKAINEIQSKVQPVVQREAERRGLLASSAQSSLEGIVGDLTYPDRQLYKDRLGEEIRAEVVGKRDAQKAEADRLYQAVRDLPGGTGRVFNGKPLQDKFESILKNLPGMEAKGEEIAYDQYGNPFTKQTEQARLLEKWPPDKLLGRLREITSAKDPKFALSDLVQMRRDVYDDIAKGEGVPNLGTRYLSQIGKALTEAIDEGVSSLPNSDLKNALRAADTHYKNNVVPFNRLGLTELFRAADEPGHVASDQVVNRVLGSGGDVNRNWQLMKETLGENSPTFSKLKRAVADNLIEPARDVAEGTLDAKQLIQNVYGFQQSNRRIYDEVFSPSEREFFRNARTLQYAQGDKIDAGELQKLLTQAGDPNAPKLNDLIKSEKRKTDLYRNSLVKSIGDGTVDEATLRPAEFVNKLLGDKGFGVEDTQNLMKLIQGNPQLEQDLRQKTFERIFRDAARPAKAQDITRTAAGDNTHILSGVLLNQALKDQTYKNKLATILGPDAFTDLQNYIKLTAPLEQKEEAYRLAGGLAAGTRVAQLERVLEGGRGLMKFAGNTARSFVFSYMLSNPVARTWLTRTADNPAAAKTAIMSILSSPPFVQAVAKQFPGLTGARFINSIRDSVQNSIEGQAQPGQPNAQGPQSDDQNREFWRQQLNQK